MTAPILTCHQDPAFEPQPGFDNLVLTKIRMGHENRRSSKVIARLLGLQHRERDCQAVLGAVSRLRDAGIVICSDNRGLWLPRDAADLEPCKRYLWSRFKRLNETLRSIDKNAAELIDGALGQLKMWEE